LLVADGTLTVSGDGSDNLFGDTVQLRQSIGVHGDACTTMIDTRHALPAGVLKYFYVFIEHNNPADPSGSFLSLQIWRRFTVNEYQLLWQRLAYLNDSSPQALYAVKQRRPE